MDWEIIYGNIWSTESKTEQIWQLEQLCFTCNVLDICLQFLAHCLPSFLGEIVVVVVVVVVVAVYPVTQLTTHQSQCYCHLIKVYGDHLNIDLPCKIWLVPIIEYCTNRGNPPITITKLFLDHHHFLSNCFPDGLLNWAIKFKRVPWSYNWSFEFKIK